MRAEPVILLVEDDANDVLLLHRAFAKAGLACQIIDVGDGQQAIDYLDGRPPFSDRAQFPIPTMLLLDLKLPRLDGFDVLTWLHERPDLACIRVVVLSASGQEKDLLRARRLGAADYQVKPSDFNSLTRLARDLQLKWLDRPPAGRKARAGRRTMDYVSR